jgi:Flp pilus assembly protein CpaB
VEHTRKQTNVPKLRGLPTSRTGAVVLALICAAVAAVVIVVAINNYRKSVDATVRQDTVLVATANIPKGTSADVAAGQAWFKPMLVVAKHMTAGAISDATILRGRVATRDIVAGEQIAATDFGIAGGVPAQLDRVQRAISISLDTSHGLGGSLEAGDHVDVYGTYGSGNSPVTRLIVPNAEVLRPGTGGSAGLGSSSGQNVSVLLQVNATDAGALALTADVAKVWLVLRGNNASNTNRDLITVGSILASGNPRGLATVLGTAPTPGSFGSSSSGQSFGSTQTQTSNSSGSKP